MNKDCKEVFSDKGEVLVIRKELVRMLGNVNDAIIFNQIHYWIAVNEKANKNFRDGKYWVFNTYKSWRERDFDFWSEDTISRSLKRLIEKGIVICANYNKLLIDKTKWYTIDYDAFQKIYDKYTEENGNEQQSAKCGHETADCGFNNAGCGMDNAKCGHETADCMEHYQRLHSETTPEIKEESKPIQDFIPETNAVNQSIYSSKEESTLSKYEGTNEGSISIYKDYDSTIVYYNVEYIERDILPEDFKKALRAGAEKAIDDNPIGYLVGVNLREAFPESLIYFCEEYYRHYGEMLEVPTDKEFTWLVQRYYMKDVTGNILFEDCAYYFSDYKEMIDRYFRTDYGKAKKDLKHFMSDGIREPFYTEMREAEKAEFERKCGNKPDTRNIPLFIPEDEEEEDDNLPF